MCQCTAIICCILRFSRLSHIFATTQGSFIGTRLDVPLIEFSSRFIRVTYRQCNELYDNALYIITLRSLSLSTP